MAREGVFDGEKPCVRCANRGEDAPLNRPPIGGDPDPCALFPGRSIATARDVCSGNYWYEKAAT